MPDSEIAGAVPVEVSFMRRFRPTPERLRVPRRTYGTWARGVQAFAAAGCFTFAWVFAGAQQIALGAGPDPDPPIKIVALGDSLTAGLGLPADQSFPAKLDKALRARGDSVEV